MQFGRSVSGRAAFRASFGVSTFFAVAMMRWNAFCSIAGDSVSGF